MIKRRKRMKKIPTLFERVFENHKIVGITPNFTDEKCKEAFKNGTATIKIDGSCCAIINGEFYKRYDAKKGKKVPEGAIPCCDPDTVTGHWPHWVKVDVNDPGDKWFIEAFNNTMYAFPIIVDATYEACGPHFQGNPHKLHQDRLYRHGMYDANVKRTFEGVKEWLENNNEEGLVFWLNDEPVCKIKRSDFGLPWNKKGGKNDI
jgi:hypothetical protein